MENNNKNTKVFVERELTDEVEGEYDDEGFFNTPNGSFWDPDGVYFNREGFDKHGGYYDENTQEYIPGKGWDEVNNCYKDEYNEDYDDEYGSDHDYMEDDGFGDIDLDKIQDEEKLLFKNMNDIEKINEDPTKIVHHIPAEEDNSKDKEEDKKEEQKKEEPKKEEKKKSKLAMLLDDIADEKKGKKKKENDKKENKKKENDKKENEKKENEKKENEEKGKEAKGKKTNKKGTTKK